MCQKMLLLDADSLPWTPIFTLYKLLEIERPNLLRLQVLYCWE
jgi:hypothetical protein